MLQLLGLTLAAGGALGAHFGAFSPVLGGLLTLGGIFLLTFLFLGSLAGLLRKGRRELSWPGLTLGFAATCLTGAIAALVLLHPVSDLSTDTGNPPRFRHPAYAFRVEKGLEYADASLEQARGYDPAQAAAQLSAYPSVEPIAVKAPPREAFQAAMEILRAQFPEWRMRLEDIPSLHAELEVASPLFGFLDDLAIEARPVPKREGEARIELRSRARVPLADLGASARRIEDLRLRLAAGLRPLEDSFMKPQEEKK